jgi:hypothetical protein
MLELLIAKLGIPLEEAQRSYAGEGCERRPPPAAAGSSRAAATLLEGTDRLVAADCLGRSLPMLPG